MLPDVGAGAAGADEAVKRARRGGEVSEQRIGEREAEARVREVSGRSYASGFSDGPSKELATSTVVSSRAAVSWLARLLENSIVYLNEVQGVTTR